MHEWPGLLKYEFVLAEETAIRVIGKMIGI